MTTELMQFDKARAALTLAYDVDEVKTIRDKAAALAHYARQQGESLEMQNQIAEIKLRAERRAGELLAGMEKSKGGRPGNSHHRGESLSEYQEAIADNDIKQNTAIRWQQIATIPEPTFEKHIAETKAAGDELTTASTLRVAKKIKNPGKTIDVHFSSNSDEWGTPDWLYNRLDKEFNFTLDVCATDDNAKCESYFTQRDDGLSQDWRGSCWMNPPYGDSIKHWMKKAAESAEAGATVVCLIPARVDTRWWWNWAVPNEIRFLNGRIKFLNADGRNDAAPFPSAVVVMSPHHESKVVWWRIPKHDRV